MACTPIEAVAEQLQFVPRAALGAWLHIPVAVVLTYGGLQVMWHTITKRPELALFMLGFIAVLAGAISVLCRRVCIGFSDQRLVYFGLRGRPTVSFRWDQVRRVAFDRKASNLQVVTDDGQVHGILLLGLEAAALELVQRVGASAFVGEAWIRRTSSAPVAERTFRYWKLEDVIASVGALAGFSLLVTSALVMCAPSGRLPVIFAGMACSYAFYRCIELVRTPLERWRTGRAIINDDFIEVSWSRGTKRVYWRHLQVAIRMRSPDWNQGILLADGRAALHLPASLSRREEVVDMVLRHAPEDAVLFGFNS